MKSVKFIIAVALPLQIGVLFAGNESLTPVMEVNSAVSMMTLAPSTPVEATFEEVIVDNTFFGLSPVTPEFASFEDFSVELVSVMDLSPVVPSEADFSDTVEFSINQLAPITPFEADFE